MTIYGVTKLREVSAYKYPPHAQVWSIPFNTFQEFGVATSAFMIRYLRGVS